MTRDELLMLQALPLNIKVAKTKLRIREFIDRLGINNVYVSFSGGKDSTVLLHLIREVEKEYVDEPVIPAVFCNTGLEFPELVQFVKKQENIETIRPKLTFKEVITKYGYPVVSKETSERIHLVKDCNISEKLKDRYLHGKSYQRIPYKWQYLLESDFKINKACCEVMKKRPFHKYEKDNKKSPFLGTMACESMLRKNQYIKNGGCNVFESAKGSFSTPLAFWTENDVLEYIVENNIEITSVYGDIVVYKEIDGKKYYTTTKEQRTGCMFCMFGCHLENEPNKFQRMKHTHEKLYNYCMNGGKYNENGEWLPDKGLGLSHVLDTINVKY